MTRTQIVCSMWVGWQLAVACAPAKGAPVATAATGTAAPAATGTAAPAATGTAAPAPAPAATGTAMPTTSGAPKLETPAPGSLQELAMSIFLHAHPDWHLTLLGRNGIAVKSLGKTLDVYLDNIERDAGADRVLAEALIRKTMRMLEQEFPDTDTETYASVEARLRPVLVPRAYAERYGLATRNFVSSVQEALVVDAPEAIRYVRAADLSRWHVSFAAAAATARSGLWKASSQVKISAQGGDDPSVKGKLVTLAVGDGYDAARLALPEVQKAIAAALGYPFYVAVPNRDFLVAWSHDASFASHFSERVKSDYASQGHAISPEIYVVDRNGVHAKP